MSLERKSNWILPENNSKDIVNDILKYRGIKDTEKFLHPQLKDIPEFNKLYDVKSAAKKILQYVNEEKKIVIHGDYDSDGICAVSILWEFLYRDLAKFLNKKIDVLPYIPSRIDQGYGLTESSLNDVLDLGASLVISVDCGVRDKALIQKYHKEKGLDFVITDHHQPPEDLSDNLDYTLVHQMYPNHEYPELQICGSTVVFLLIQAIKQEAGMDYEITEDTKGLDLVALATITDLMPLVGVNRILVTYGLKQIHKDERLGLRTLILRAGLVPKDIESYHLGYVVGPRINAAGRIASPMDAVKLLVSNDQSQCQEIANTLNSINFERQTLTSKTLEEAKALVNEQNKLLFVVGHNWHEGIIGLVAGKLQEEYYKPVLVATNNEGIVKGSARSIKGFNITKTLETFNIYLDRFGGHELAAGFTAKTESIDTFVQEITDFANKEIPEENLTQNLKIDLVLDSDDISYELIDSLKSLEPYGFGNPKPIVCIKDLVVLKKNIMGQDKNHMKLTVKGEGIEPMTIVMFGCNEDTEKIKEEDVIDVIGYPDVNVWNGNESIQFRVKEWRFNN